MASDPTALKTAFTTEIDRISDTFPLRKPEATYTLDRWFDAASGVAELESGTITSYTMAGRTFTFSGVENLRKIEGELRAKLERLIYGNTHLLDLNLQRGQT